MHGPPLATKQRFKTIESAKRKARLRAESTKKMHKHQEASKRVDLLDNDIDGHREKGLPASQNATKSK